MKAERSIRQRTQATLFALLAITAAPAAVAQPASPAPTHEPKAAPGAEPKAEKQAPVASPVQIPEPSKAEPPAPRSNVPAYVAMGLAGGAVVMGTIFGVAALGAHSDFKKDSILENARKTERYALIADVSFGIAFASGVTGTVLLLSNLSRKPAPQDAPKQARFVVPFVCPTGGGVVGVVTF